MTLQFRWWEYILMGLSVFIGSVFLNFFVKKINEARLEERLIRLQKRNSTNRSTQVQETFPVEQTSLKENQSIYSENPGISFVYNKEDNLKNNRDTTSNLSTESSKESSKLKFLGTIYTKEGVFINHICYYAFGEVMDLMALVGSAVNFVLYCSMSRQFRSTFTRLAGKVLPLSVERDNEPGTSTTTVRA